ncbi:MAG: hypothetical protein JRD05_03970 [Deltaproteobacteria bacterium]|nr:hypothetical protein [Deltaproteobacteria bacterium]
MKQESFSFTGKCNVVPFGDVVFQDKTPKERKKNQRLPTSLGGISNQQTNPRAGPNYQPGKLNGGQAKGRNVHKNINYI